MRDQHPLGHAGVVQVVQPLDIEAGELGLDTFRDGDVRDEAATVDGDQVAGQRGESGEVLGHAGTLDRPEWTRNPRSGGGSVLPTPPREAHLSRPYSHRRGSRSRPYAARPILAAP